LGAEPAVGPEAEPPSQGIKLALETKCYWAFKEDAKFALLCYILQTAQKPHKIKWNQLTYT